MRFPTAYQPAVDGLRAVSIVSVVAYHAGTPGFSGGFVGVDVFFVISGYLIINQILAGLQAGQFSFGDFWARRVLRILPPFLLVILASAMVGGFILVTPSEFNEFGREVGNSALMVVNFHFYARQGYFDTDAELKPLLHLWTLAVEEQFYLIAPLLLFGLWQLARRLAGKGPVLWLTVGGATFAASLAACIGFTNRDTNPAFYLMWFRAWEFILGGALSFLALPLRRLPNWTAEIVGAAGVALIVYAVFAFSDRTLFPSYSAVLPVLGGGLVILAALALPTGLVARGLAMPPLVWIGLVSYSWYLWHWPALAFTRLANFGDKDPRFDIAAVVLSFGLAAASYIWLEKPIRSWRRRRQPGLSDWRIVAGGGQAAAAVALIGLGSHLIVAPLLDRSFKPSVKAYLTYDGIPTTYCRIDRDPGVHCSLARTGKTGALIGDSHAGMIFPVAFANAYRMDAYLASYVAYSCQPITPNRDFGGGERNRCSTRLRNALAGISGKLGSDMSFAILAARWHTNVRNDDTRDFQLLADGGPPLPTGADRSFVAGLTRTIQTLRGLGAKRILLVGPTPAFRHSVPRCVLWAARLGIDRDRCAESRQSVDASQAQVLTALRRVASASPDIRIADTIPVLCDNARCRPYDAGGILYKDKDHLTDRGVDKLYAGLRDDFEWAFGGGKSQRPAASLSCCLANRGLPAPSSTSDPKRD